MFLGWIRISLVLQHLQRGNDAGTGLLGLDHFVDVSYFRRDVGIVELLPEFGGQRFPQGVGIIRLGQLPSVEHVHRGFRTHDGELSGWPCVVDVGAYMLAVHHAVGTAVRLARDDGDSRHRALAERVEQLCAFLDDAAVFLADAREKPGHVFENDQRYIEGVAEAHEPRAFDRRVDVQYPCEGSGLIGDDAGGPAIEPGKPHDDIVGECSMHFEEIAVVHHPVDHVLDVVGFVGVIGYDAGEFLVHAVRVVRGAQAKRILHVVRGQVRHELLHHGQARGFVGRGKVGDARHGIVNLRTAQLVERHLFVGHRADDVRTGDEHVTGIFHHEDEVGHRRRIDRAARTGSHDHRNLRDHAGSQHVAQEDVGIAREADHPFLDTRAAGILQTDHRRPVLHRQVHELADLLPVGLAQRTAEYCEVFRHDVDAPSVDRTVARDHAVAQDFLALHAEIAAVVGHEGADLLETAFVQEKGHPFPGGPFPRLVLPGDALLAAAFSRLFP